MGVCPIPAIQMLHVQTNLEHSFVNVRWGMKGMDRFANLKVYAFLFIVSNKLYM